MVRHARNNKLCSADMTPEVCATLEKSRLLLTTTTQLGEDQIDVILKSATTEAYNLGGDMLFPDNIESCVQHLVKHYKSGEAHLLAIIQDSGKIANIWAIT